jgi:uncharacterized protein involved in exopolysaccharide biosynthesis
MNAPVAADSAALLREAIAITGNMLAAANADDWDTVALLEVERAVVIAESADMSREVGGLLEELLALNKELEQLACVGRNAASEVLDQARHNAVAVDAYQRTGFG